MRIDIVTSSALRSLCIKLLHGCPDGHVCIDIVNSGALKLPCIKLLHGCPDGHLCIDMVNQLCPDVSMYQASTWLP